MICVWHLRSVPYWGFIIYPQQFANSMLNMGHLFSLQGEHGEVTWMLWEMFLPLVQGLFLGSVDLG